MKYKSEKRQYINFIVVTVINVVVFIIIMIIITIFVIIIIVHGQLARSEKNVKTVLTNR